MTGGDVVSEEVSRLLSSGLSLRNSKIRSPGPDEKAKKRQTTEGTECHGNQEWG